MRKKFGGKTVFLVNIVGHCPCHVFLTIHRPVYLSFCSWLPLLFCFLLLLSSLKRIFAFTYPQKQPLEDSPSIFLRCSRQSWPQPTVLIRPGRERLDKSKQMHDSYVVSFPNKQKIRYSKYGGLIIRENFACITKNRELSRDGICQKKVKQKRTLSCNKNDEVICFYVVKSV